MLAETSFARASDPAPDPRRLVTDAVTYARPLLMLAVALPITVYAVTKSVSWLGRPFPGFFLMDNRVVPTVSGLSWPADKAALFHSQVVAVDGVAVHSSDEVYRYAAERPAGTPMTYTLRRGGEVLAADHADAVLRWVRTICKPTASCCSSAQRTWSLASSWASCNRARGKPGCSCCIPLPRACIRSPPCSCITRVPLAQQAVSGDGGSHPGNLRAPGPGVSGRAALRGRARA